MSDDRQDAAEALDDLAGIFEEVSSRLPTAAAVAAALAVLAFVVLCQAWAVVALLAFVAEHTGWAVGVSFLTGAHIGLTLTISTAYLNRIRKDRENG